MAPLKGADSQEAFMTLRTLFLVGLCWPLLGALAQEQPADKPPGVIELRQQANAAYEAKDYSAYRDALNGLHALRPYNDKYMYQVVLANALLEDHSNAYAMMLKMQQQGLAADFDLTSDTQAIRGTEAYTYINDLLKRADEPMGSASLEFQLPSDVVLVTSMAWDPGRESFLVGTASLGAVFAVTRDGTTRELLRADDTNGLWGIFGLLVDVERNRLWVTSSADENFVGFDTIDAGRAALFEFELDTLKLVKRYPVPVDGRPHRLGGMAVAPGGDLYAVDTILPFVYRLDAGAERMQPYAASADMVSMRGLAISEDGGKLYVADHELGVLVLDSEAKTAVKLRVEDKLNMGGIEGLFYWQGHLVMIQNGISPHRIMRLKLADDGLAVTEVAPMAVAQPFFNYPNFGAVVGDDLFFLANSHWIRGQQQPEPIGVARTSIGSPANLVPVDMQKFMEEFEADRARRAQAGEE